MPILLRVELADSLRQRAPKPVDPLPVPLMDMWFALGIAFSCIEVLA